ncbi:major facilitator superfamily domain-containing protein [Mycena rosella]|uniref:Major facilitator superfamily domain-containing protein n=1 Tax=Mycena rosella TaxID=1033263 RepID=A0AAD7GQF7_MYCRO|nr:major facilitator superfamily domain-containing protein [Mycena rosella]
MAQACTPLPKLQLTIALTDDAPRTVIFPFVPQVRKTGYWAGVLESVFFVAEFLSVYSWGRASDRFGRRPVLLLGPLGLAFSLLGFGLSKNFGALVVFRCAQGIFNGNIGVVKTVMAEIADTSNLAQIMALIPLAFSSGSTLGPIIGGLFSDPADHWPNSFGKFRILREHPYLLPCSAVGLISLSCFFFALVALKEVTPVLYPSTTHDSDKLHLSVGVPTLRELLVPRLVIPLLNYCFYCFLQTAYQVLFPLMYSTSIENGGLGFSPYQIGVTRGIWGIMNTFCQLFLAVPLIRRFGARRIYIIAFANFTICIGAYPLLSFCARRSNKVDAIVWTIVGIQLISNLAISMASSASRLYIVCSSPSPSALSSTNSLAQMMSTLSRALAPFVASALFAISLEWDVAGGHMVYIILLGMVAAGIWCSFLLSSDSNTSARGDDAMH